jgi:hypothetical protein
MILPPQLNGILAGSLLWEPLHVPVAPPARPGYSQTIKSDLRLKAAHRDAIEAGGSDALREAMGFQ